MVSFSQKTHGFSEMAISGAKSKGLLGEFHQPLACGLPGGSLRFGQVWEDQFLVS